MAKREPGRIPSPRLVVSTLRDPDFLELVGGGGAEGWAAFGVFVASLMAAKDQDNAGKFASRSVLGRLIGVGNQDDSKMIPGLNQDGFKMESRCIQDAINLISDACSRAGTEPWLVVDGEAVIIRNYERYNPRRSKNWGGPRRGSGRPKSDPDAPLPPRRKNQTWNQDDTHPQEVSVSVPVGTSGKGDRGKPSSSLENPSMGEKSRWNQDDSGSGAGGNESEDGAGTERADPSTVGEALERLWSMIPDYARRDRPAFDAELSPLLEEGTVDFGRVEEAIGSYYASPEGQPPQPPRRSIQTLIRAQFWNESELAWQKAGGGSFAGSSAGNAQPDVNPITGRPMR